MVVEEQENEDPESSDHQQ
jgi:hypothetical protein